jgi:hypothetical protein
MDAPSTPVGRWYTTVPVSVVVMSSFLEGPISSWCASGSVHPMILAVYGIDKPSKVVLKCPQCNVLLQRTGINSKFFYTKVCIYNSGYVPSYGGGGFYKNINNNLNYKIIEYSYFQCSTFLI